MQAGIWSRSYQGGHVDETLQSAKRSLSIAGRVSTAFAASRLRTHVVRRSSRDRQRDELGGTHKETHHGCMFPTFKMFREANGYMTSYGLSPGCLVCCIHLDVLDHEDRAGRHARLSIWMGYISGETG
jgi:hypothetical protein